MNCQPDNSPPLCASNCGFYGNPLTKNLCSKCYIASQKKAQEEAARTEPSPPTSEAPSAQASTGPEQTHEQTTLEDSPGKSETSPMEPAVQVNTSRCWTCQRRTGLLGFQCRCGYTFCGEHRYADSHSCTFDYATFEREQLRQANTKVTADKVRKI